VDLCVDCDAAARDRAGDCDAENRVKRETMLASTSGRCANCGTDDDDTLEAHAIVPVATRGHPHA